MIIATTPHSYIKAMKNIIFMLILSLSLGEVTYAYTVDQIREMLKRDPNALRSMGNTSGYRAPEVYVAESHEDKSCESISSNKEITLFVETLEQIEKIAPGYNEGVRFDHRLSLKQWVEEKFNAAGDGRKRLESLSHEWVNKCLYELRGTKYLWLFTGISYQSQNINRLDNLRKVLDYAAQETNPRAKKSLDSNGNWTVITSAPSQANKPHVIQPFNIRSFDYTVPVAYALYLGGDNAVSSVGKIINQELTAELARVQNVDANQKMAQAKQQDEALAKQDRLVRIKNGDFKAAKNCIEIHKAIGAEESLKAIITPHQRFRGAAGKLLRFEESRSTGYGVGVISSNGLFAQIKTSSNTMWPRKELIAIGSMVIVVGKYVDNTFINLADGSSKQSPVFDAVCIQPY